MRSRPHPSDDPNTLEFQVRERFDMDYGTNTTTPLAKSGFAEVPNLDHGKPYMASWTSEIEKSFDFLQTRLGRRLGLYTFVDIGCGKGKVPIVWRLKCRQAGIDPRIVGMDYYPPFITIARDNHRKVFGHPGEFLLADAAAMDYAQLGPGVIAYLYNPFDAVILNAVLTRLRTIPTIVIYNIPTHSDVIGGHGFIPIHARRGINQNQETHIFSNHLGPQASAGSPELRKA